MTSRKSDFAAAATRVAKDHAAPAADSVDREARFPKEAIDGLRQAKLLSAYVPVELGGGGCTIEDLSAMCFELGQRCANAAMVFAMHQIQVGCLVRHGIGAEPFRAYMRELVEKQLLLASATTEAGVASVSAPVRSPGGKIIAAVSVSGPLERLTRQPGRMHAPAVLAAAERLSESLRRAAE